MRRRRSIQGRCGVLGLVVLALAGVSCDGKARPSKRGEPPAIPTPPGAPAVDGLGREVVAVDDLPPELRGAVRESAQRQAEAGGEARARLLRAWNYAPPPKLDRSLGAKLVAVELQLDIPGTGFDLDDLDIVDAATGENHGSDPLLQRLTTRGEPVDFDDPAVADPHHFRLLAVWAVPRAVKRIRLDYWKQSLSEEIAITGTRGDLRVIEESDAAIGYGVGPATATAERSHYLLVECFCSRVAHPPSYQLLRGEELINEGRAVEVDETMAPMTTPVESRPYYGRRTWIIEYAAPAGVEVSAVNQFGKHTALPRRPVNPGAALLAALAQLPLDRF